MTPRFHRRSPEFDHRMPMTDWQRERARGPILPMEQARTGIFARLFAR